MLARPSDLVLLRGYSDHKAFSYHNSRRPSASSFPQSHQSFPPCYNVRVILIVLRFTPCSLFFLSFFFFVVQPPVIGGLDCLQLHSSDGTTA